MNKNFIQKRTFINTSAFITLFCLPFLLSPKVSAASSINPVYGLRYYFYNQGGLYPTAEDGIYGGIESANTPFPIISSVPSGSTFIALKRLIINTPVNIGDSSARFNNISVYYTFTQSPGSYEGKSWTTMYYQPQFSYRRNDGSTETKYCNISVDNRTTLQFHCSISLSDYKTIDYLTLLWGGTFESNQTFWQIGQVGYIPGSTNPNYDGALTLQSVSYDLESAQDPAISQNNTMIQQNQIMIEQNNRIATDIEYGNQLWEQSVSETQNAANQGNQNSDASRADNEQASQNIFGVVGSVIGAFNTSERSCSIPVVASGVDLGEINFCSGKPPFWAQLVGGVGSIILVYAIYKTALAVFQWFIAMTAFGQGNGRGDNG